MLKLIKRRLLPMTDHRSLAWRWLQSGNLGGGAMVKRRELNKLLSIMEMDNRPPHTGATSPASLDTD